MEAHFDLDAARAARAETRGENPTTTFGGEIFKLPPEIDLEAAEQLMYGSPTAFVKVLLVDDWERFMAKRPTISDIKDLADWLAGYYGFTSPGESPASPSSSTSTGTPSRPTSSGTTANRSQRRATAKKAASRSAGSKPS